MTRIPGFLKDPLAHFLIAGAALVYVGGLVAPAEPARERIVVDREAVLDFIQYRSKAFEPQAAAALLDSLSPERRAQLIDDFVREEALYREAKAAGLEADDYVIRQRLVQKLTFAAEAAAGEPTLTDAEIAAYYEANKGDYVIPPFATFTHVFFSAEKRGADNARAAAESQSRRLNKTAARFEDAVKFGDRFVFDTNYVERTYDYVASQFGDDAAAAIFDPAGPFEVWRGPLVSQYGAHVIYVAAIVPGRTPDLEEVRARVAEDAARARKVELVRELIDRTVADYDVVIDLGETAP